jgi:hypothetical protein
VIKYITYDDIDKSKWDSCIRSSVNGMIYAYSWYLDIACNKWDGLVEDDYKSVMPLPRGEKYGFLYTYQPPFSQQHGVFSTSKITNEKVKEFLKGIPAKYKYVELSLNTFNRPIEDSFETSEGVTHLLDLISPYDTLQSNYSTQTKRNLKKALSSSLAIAKAVSPKKVIDLFKANRGKNYDISSAHYTIANNLMQTCIKKGLGQCWGVYTKEKELCAAAFLVESNRRTIFLFSGTNKKAFETHAMTFLINRYIEENAQQNLTFDFEGSSDPDVARFYKGFGAKEAHYVKIRKNNLPAPVKWLKEIQFKKKSGTGK